MKNILPLFVLLFCLVSSAQNNYGIRIPKTLESQKRFCGKMTSLFQKTPKEVAFGVAKDEKNNLYIQFNNKAWFKQLFINPYDGLAVDIVTKNQFDCNQPIIESQIRGEILKPTYSSNLKNNIETIQEGFYRVLLGKLPSEYHAKKLEFNMLFISNKNLCRYQTTYNLQSYNYQLLDMGLYLDSIVFNKNSVQSKELDGLMVKYKTLNFKIPFEKNKSIFSKEDIQPLYDSLRLTDYEIKKIEIKAYSSIEGSYEKNKALQFKRSESIINALQSFQKPTIRTEITNSENWVEFLNDIQDTEFNELQTLSKSEIKRRINGELATRLEKYLKHHRKALVTLYLDKIDYYREFTGEQLVKSFNRAIKEDQLEEASRLQKSLFEKMKLKEISPDLLYELEVPKQKKYVDFFNSTSAFRYRLDRNNLLMAYYDFQEINKWAPNNKKILYNLLALKLRINHGFKSIPEETDLLNKIEKLKKLGIENGLIDRMLVNHHITKSELLMQQGKYEEKDESVKLILKLFKNFPLSDDDYLSLAQYITYYYDNKTAIELIKNQVNRIDVEKKLLFYYLNLTIINDDIVNKAAYRTILLNAVNIDKTRFCKIFNSSQEDGVTFQLLDNTYLKKNYCENCNN